MHFTQLEIEYLVGAVLLLVSVICDIYVAATAFISKTRIAQDLEVDEIRTHNYVISDLIFWLSIIDLFVNIVDGINIGVPWDDDHVPMMYCQIVAFLTLLSSIFLQLWHMLIATYLFYLLISDNYTHKNCCLVLFPCVCCNKCINNNSTNNNNYSYNYNNNNINNNNNNSNSNSNCDASCLYLRNDNTWNIISLLIVILSFIGAVMPCIWHKNRYGMINDGFRKSICFSTNSSYSVYVYYSITFCVVLFHLLVIIMSIIKYYQTKSYTVAYLHLIKRLLPWIIVYALVRMFPTYLRVHEAITGDNQQSWIALASYYCFLSGGIANGIIWYFTKMRININNISNAEETSGLTTLYFTRFDRSGTQGSSPQAAHVQKRLPF